MGEEKSDDVEFLLRAVRWTRKSFPKDGRLDSWTHMASRIANVQAVLRNGRNGGSERIVRGRRANVIDLFQQSNQRSSGSSGSTSCRQGQKPKIEDRGTTTSSTKVR